MTGKKKFENKLSWKERDIDYYRIPYDDHGVLCESVIQ